MILGSGKLEGKSSFLVVLDNPGYAQWYTDEYPHSRIGSEFNRLIELFNAKPFVKLCHHCGRQAKQASAYRQNYDFMFWCDECDPYDNGASVGTLTFVKTYREALLHIDGRCGGSRAWKRKAIKSLARAKGLPNRNSAKAAEDFFA